MSELDEVKQGSAFVSTYFINIVELNNKVILFSSVLKELFDTELIDVIDKDIFKYKQFYPIDLKNGKLAWNIVTINYVISSYRVYENASIIYTKNIIAMKEYSPVANLIIYRKDKPAIIVVDDKDTESYMVDLIRWDNEKNYSKKEILFSLAHDNYNTMFDYLKRILHVMELYL